MSAMGRPDDRQTVFTRVEGGWIAFVLPYLVAAAWFWLLPTHHALGTSLAIMVLFALSVEVVLGFGGINTLGQAVVFGGGAYAAGLAAIHLGFTDPFAMLAAGAAGGAAIALLTGALVLRGGELTVLAMTLVAAAIFYELTNTFSSITGGFDGLRGIRVQPVFGLFRFDLWQSTAFVFCTGVVLVCHLLVRILVTSPFGVMMRGLRANPGRMAAFGAPVMARLLLVYTVGGALGGLAGALQTITTRYVSGEVFAFHVSATVVVVMILGGFGRIYGAFMGAAAYVVFQDYFAKLAPQYWFFWLGLLLVVVVIAAPGGLVGLIDMARARLGRLRR